MSQSGLNPDNHHAGDTRLLPPAIKGSQPGGRRSPQASVERIFLLWEDRFAAQCNPTKRTSMDSDEREIYEYLKSWPQHYISAREICLRAGGKRRFREDSRWALPALARLVKTGLLEVDASDRYRISNPESRSAMPAPPKPRRWVAPHIARILKLSGKDFGDVDGSGANTPDTR